MPEVRWLKVVPMRFKFKSCTFENISAPRKLRAALHWIFENECYDIWRGFRYHARVLADEVSKVIKDAVDYLLGRRVHMVVAEVDADGKTYLLTNRHISFIDDKDHPGYVVVHLIDMTDGKYYMITQENNAFDLIHMDRFDEAVIAAAIAMKGDEVVEKIAEVLEEKGVDKSSAFTIAEKFVEKVGSDPRVWTVYLATGDEDLIEEAIYNLINEWSIFQEKTFEGNFFKLLERFKYPFRKTLGFIRKFSIASTKEDGVEYHLLKFKESSTSEKKDHVKYVLVAVDPKARKVNVEAEVFMTVLTDYEDSVDDTFKWVMKKRGAQDLSLLLKSNIVVDISDLMFNEYEPNLEHLRLCVESQAYKESTAITEYDDGSEKYTIVFLFKGQLVLVVKDEYVGLTSMYTFLEELCPEAIIAKYPIIETLKEYGSDVALKVMDEIMSDPSVAGLLPPETVAKMAELYADLAYA